MFDPTVEMGLEKLTALLAEDPEAAEVLQRMQEGGFASEAEAMHALLSLMQQKPALATKLMQGATTAFAPTREEETALAELFEVEPPTAIFKPDAGLDRLNPLYEAALAERLQFDGDIPERRTGNLPEGGTPAVPVLTDARNPVAVGMMLMQASEEVGEQIKRLQVGFENDVAGLIQEAERTGTALEVATKNLPAHAPDPVGYERGQLPAPREMDAPDGAALALLSEEQRQVAAWKAISTTQGRRSMKNAVLGLIEEGLRDAGIEVRVNEHPTFREEVPVYAEWTVDISGSKSSHPNFAFADVAAASLVKRLVAQMAESPVHDPVLEVITVDTVDVRKVGWAARVVSG